MNKSSMNLILCLLVGLFCLTPITILAEDQQPPLAEEWLFTVKADQTGAFHAAMKAHAEFRQESNDPRSWQVYEAIVGQKLNQYVIRHCCFNWADLDTHTKWDEDHPQVLGHWFETVAPHVVSTEHYFSEVDWPNSNWSADAGPFRYFVVNEWNIKGGHEADFAAARKTMSQIAINQGWANASRNWVWTTQVGGRATSSVVVPHRNFASMGGSEETFFEFLTEHMGSAESAGELMKKFSASTWGTTTTIWEHRPKLSFDESD